MSAEKPCFEDLASLKNFVVHTLCSSDHLDPTAFPISEHQLTRNGYTCGLVFTIHGPRAVVLTAIWEVERNRVLFYDSGGTRFQTTELAHGPAISA